MSIDLQKLGANNSYGKVFQKLIYPISTYPPKVVELNFFEASLKEIDQLTEHPLGIYGSTFGTHHKLGAFTGSQHHKAHNTLAVDLLTVFFHPYFKNVAIVLQEGGNMHAVDVSNGIVVVENI